MFKFTIRDLIWLMLFSGFVVHSWIEKSKNIGERNLRRQLQQAWIERDEARRELKIAKANAKRYAALARDLDWERIQSGANLDLPLDSRRFGSDMPQD